LTRERRKNKNYLETDVDQCEKLSSDREDDDLQEIEDDCDFNSALSTAQAYELLDDATHVLDDLLSQQQSD
jgi:hypothetical protein